MVLERIKEDEEASVSVRNTSKNATRFFITLANKICTPYMHLTVRRMGNFFIYCDDYKYAWMDMNEIHSEED